MSHAFAALLCAFKSRSLGVIALFASLSLVSNLRAEESEVYRVEEDWELRVIDPDPVSYSPQITFFASPTTSDSNYFQLQMNYAADDDFTGGGFHVAAVRGDQIVDEARSFTRIPLRTDGDRIRWTNVMAAFDNAFFFAVRDGHGDDWGAFGGPEYLVEMPADGVDDLDQYTHVKSLEDLDIGFGANRVSSLKLLRVRLFYKNGHHVTISVQE